MKRERQIIDMLQAQPIGIGLTAEELNTSKSYLGKLAKKGIVWRIPFSDKWMLCSKINS